MQCELLVLLVYWEDVMDWIVIDGGSR